MAEGRAGVVLVGLRYDEFYAHTLAVGYLKGYVDAQRDLAGRYRTVLVERTVHEPLAVQAGEILDADPDVVGFSCYVWNFRRVVELAKALKTARPGLRIALGGPEVSVRGPSVLAEVPEADVVVRGEGEETFAEVLRAWAAGRGLEGVLGATWRGAAGPVENLERPLISDLATIPSPFLNGLFKVREGERLALETSRGCPLQCRFCDWQNFQATRWFPAERAVAEVAAVLRQAGGIYYFVTDADIFTDDDRAAYLLAEWDRITGRESVHWHLQTFLNNVQEKASRLLDSYKFSLGCGIETIQPRALKRMVRGFTRRGVERSINRLKANAPQVGVHLQLISGLPDDDLPGHRRSLEWALSMRSDSLFLPRGLALPGAEFGKDPAKYGISKVMPEPPYFILETETFSAPAIVEADRLAFRVLNTHKVGLLRRTLEELGPEERPEKPEAAPATPWVDLYERFYAHMEGVSDFYKRATAWYEGQDALGKVMDQEPLDFSQLPAAERLAAVAGLADFARAELSRAGRDGRRPELERFLKTQEARVLWEKVLDTAAFSAILAHLSGGVRSDSPRLRWLGWELLEAEAGLCHRARQIHVVSTLMYDRFEVCRRRGSAHVHVEDQTHPERWEALLPEGGPPFAATVVSNVYWAIPPALRVPVLRRLREGNPDPDGRLVLWVDDVGLSPLEFVGRAGEACGPADPAAVRADLEAAGWELCAEPRTLSARGTLCGRVCWTFFSARPAGRKALARGAAAESGRAG